VAGKSINCWKVGEEGKEQEMEEAGLGCSWSGEKKPTAADTGLHTVTVMYSV
jgi:hypothetical protein